MAEESKKPRNIKDLKARLGRGPGVTPAPASGESGAGAPALVPPPVAGSPAHGEAVAPEAAPPVRPRPADPFAAPSAAAPRAQEFRLVIDEKPVAESDALRKSRKGLVVALVATTLLGLAAGWGGGSVMGERNLYNSVVRDGKSVYQTVQTASGTMTKASNLVRRAVTKARSSAGQPPAVDYQAIEALQALPKPLAADAFSRRLYGAFNPGTVDLLFEYYNGVQLLWDKFRSLGATTLSENRRGELNRAAAAASELASRQVGCVPFSVGDMVACGLVLVDMPQNQDQETPLPAELAVRARAGSAPFQKKRYTGQELTESPDDYVMLVETTRSIGVLGQSATVFAEYQRDLLGINGLMERTMQSQGRLEQELGAIARLEEQFAF